MHETIARRFAEALAAIGAARDALGGRIAQAAQVVTDCLRAGGGVFTFGNGGSAADAQHIAGEMVGSFLNKTRRALRATALTCDSSVITSLANDRGYETVFARQLEAAGRAGDVAIAISTSGNSPSVIRGLEAARKLGMKTIVLTGSGGGKCAPLGDVVLAVPSKDTPRIQEAHAVIYHIICELVESALA